MVCKKTTSNAIIKQNLELLRRQLVNSDSEKTQTLIVKTIPTRTPKRKKVDSSGEVVEVVKAAKEEVEVEV